MKTKYDWIKILGGLPSIAIALILPFSAPKGPLKQKKVKKSSYDFFTAVLKNKSC